jgi:hypothetical protein
MPPKTRRTTSCQPPASPAQSSHAMTTYSLPTIVYASGSITQYSCWRTFWEPFYYSYNKSCRDTQLHKEDANMADADDAKTLRTLQKTRHQLETYQRFTTREPNITLRTTNPYVIRLKWMLTFRMSTQKARVTGRTREDMLRLSRNFNFNFIISLRLLFSSHHFPSKLVYVACYKVLPSLLCLPSILNLSFFGDNWGT